jgi:hypothetical protein
MLKIHVTKIDGRVVINENEFAELMEKVKESEEVKIETNEFKDLFDAASENLAFWNNEIDDEVWNNA